MFKENKNKVETIIKTSEEAPSSRLNGSQRLKESGLILAFLFSIFLAVALFSFNPADPSWSQTAWGTDIHNAGGLVGAWLADTLFFVFGSLAIHCLLLLHLQHGCCCANVMKVTKSISLFGELDSLV